MIDFAAKADQVEAILAAMAEVAGAGDRSTLSDADRVSLTAAHHYIFRQETTLDIERLPAMTPETLRSTLADQSLAEAALKLIAVMALVDGTVDPQKIAIVSAYADSLDVQKPYLKELTEAARGHLQWAGMDMVRQNMLSITGQHWVDDDVMPWLLPYQGENADPALSARFHALQNLPEGTLGHSFWHWYSTHKFAFPGEENALNGAFGVPHDSTHLLSGYDTTYRGEILVSTFTAAMHQEEPMAGHILPVIFSWHLGIELIEHAGSHKGALDPAAFWQAWRRGSDTPGDVFARDWDFWDHAETPLDALRQRYGVPPLEV